MGLSQGFMNGACLSEGQRVDMKAFPKLWALGNWEDVVHVIADKGYDVYDVRTLIRNAGKIPVIPRRHGAVCPGLRDSHKALYQTRSAIERFFGQIKESKRLCLRFDKLDCTFFAFFALAVMKALNLLC